MSVDNAARQESLLRHIYLFYFSQTGTLFSSANQDRETGHRQTHTTQKESQEPVTSRECDDSRGTEAEVALARQIVGPERPFTGEQL